MNSASCSMFFQLWPPPSPKQSFETKCKSGGFELKSKQNWRTQGATVSQRWDRIEFPLSLCEINQWHSILFRTFFFLSAFFSLLFLFAEIRLANRIETSVWSYDGIAYVWRSPHRCQLTECSFMRVVVTVLYGPLCHRPRTRRIKYRKVLWARQVWWPRTNKYWSHWPIQISVRKYVEVFPVL